MTTRRLALLATLAVTAALPSTAAAATPIGAVNWQLNSDRHLANNLLGGCILLAVRREKVRAPGPGTRGGAGA